jgi:hypothetical protein
MKGIFMKKILQVLLITNLIACSSVPANENNAPETPISITQANTLTHTPIVIETMTPTLTPEPTATMTQEPIEPVTWSDVEALNNAINEMNSGGQPFVIGTETRPLDSRASEFVVKYLKGLFSGVIPTADFGNFSVEDHDNLITKEVLELDLNTITDLGSIETQSKLIFLQFRRVLSFPTGSTYYGPYPIEDTPFPELINFYSENYQHLLKPEGDWSKAWPLNKTFTISPPDTSKLILGLNMNDQEMISAYFNLYTKIKESGKGQDLVKGNTAGPQLIFRYKTENSVLKLNDLEWVVVIELSGDPEELETNFRRAYEQMLGPSSGITFETFVMSMMIKSKFVIPVESIEELAQNK